MPSTSNFSSAPECWSILQQRELLAQLVLVPVYVSMSID
jgi:hypothetical protein